MLTALAVLTTTGIAIEDYGVEGEDYVSDYGDVYNGLSDKASDNEPTSIEEPRLTSANPTSDSVRINFVTTTGHYEVTVYDVRGRKVEEWAGSGRDVEINWDTNASGIASGVYLIRVDTGENVSVLKTVISR